MNAISILFLSLIAVANSRVPIKQNLPVKDVCKETGPEVYCASTRLKIDCKAEKFCLEYLRKPLCERGPNVYCKKKEIAISCNKEAYCLTWPDDSVTAVKIIPPPVFSRKIFAIGFWIWY